MAEEKYFLKYTAEQIDERLEKAGNAVLFTAQNFTDAQKTQARDNIGAGMVKTVNGVAPDKNGNVDVSGSGGSSGVYVLSDGETLDNVPESAVLVVDPGTTLLDAEGVGF